VGHEGWQPLPRYTLTGLHCSSRTVRTEPNSALVLMHLHPAAAPLLRQDPRGIVDRSIDLATAWPRADLDGLAIHLIHCGSDAERAACLEGFVADRLHATAADAAVVRAVNRIRAAPEDVRIGDLAHTLGISVATLERRFTANVGVSPKRYARAARLRSAVLAYSAGVTLTHVAMDAGFYDQSHFVREMRLATGQAPQRLLAARAYC
jgi:AraC-like DNA-binding protein